MAGAEAPAVALDVPAADRLLAPLLDHTHLALAVSGGSDSVALMLLASAWRQRHRDAPKLSVLTVDHQLRADAAGEAATVSGWAADLGLPHATLRWEGDKPENGLQDAARQARYRLMSQWCTRHAAQAIVTAHTLEDQAETFLMRLGRGSGIDGLSAMTVWNDAPWPLLRPLLGVTRGCLRAYLDEAGRTWIDDPSNDDCGFERVRVRKAIVGLVDCGITAEAIARSARRLDRARQVLAAQAAVLHGQAVHGCDTGEVLICLEQYTNAPQELRIRLLQRVIGEVGGQNFQRMSALERLDDWLLAETGRAKTLGNCKISKRKRQIAVARERATRRRGLKHQ